MGQDVARFWGTGWAAPLSGNYLLHPQAWRGQGGPSPLIQTALCGGCDLLQGKSWSHLGTIRPHESRGPGSPWRLREPARSLLSHQAPLRREDSGGHCVRRAGLPRAGGTSLPPTAIRGTPQRTSRPAPPAPLQRQLSSASGLPHKGEAGRLYHGKSVPSWGWSVEVLRLGCAQGWLLPRPNRACGQLCSPSVLMCPSL